MVTIYTDGSCYPNPGPGGWAFVVYEGGAEVYSASGADRQTTNNRMEIAGALEALLWLGDRPGRILSDSRYVVDGANSWTRSWARNGWQRKTKGGTTTVLNVDLWQLLVAARRPQHQVEWVRGHVGNAGNERADALAGAAREGLALLGCHRPRIEVHAWADAAPMLL